MKHISIILLICFFLSAQTTSPGDFKKSVISKSITLDGYLDEEIWSDKKSYEQFRQIRPSMNEDPNNSTRFKIHYDSDYLYVGIELFNSNLNSLFASTMNRDESQESDDNVIIIIDSYNSKSNALAFQTNMLSSRRDFELSSNNFNNVNDSWNTFWNVATQKSQNGWVAEFQIPWSSLRYEMKPKNTMGIKVIRFDKSSNETDIFPLKDASMDNADLDLVNLEEIEFENLQKSNPLIIKPYAITNFVSDYELNDTETKYINSNSFMDRKNYINQNELDRLVSNIGVDIKYRINNNTTLDATLNTDFAQVEADDQIVNLSRFSIALPEKRQFFLENANLFSFPMFFGNKLFHSRKIGIEEDRNVPIIAGLRFAGKVSDLSYGLMSIQSHEEDESKIPAINYTVARVKNNISSDDSYVGAFLANKQSNGSYHRSIATDAQWRFNNTTFFKSYLAANYSSDLAENNNLAYGLRFAHLKSEGYSTNIIYTAEEENFDSNLGFVNRLDKNTAGMWNGYQIRLNDNPIFTELGAGYWISQSHSLSTQKLVSEYRNLFLFLTFKNGYNLTIRPISQSIDLLSEEWEFNDQTMIKPGKYKMNGFNAQFDSGNGNAYKWSFNLDKRDFYNAELFSINPNLSYIFNRHLTASLGFNYNKIKFPSSMTNSKEAFYKNLYVSRLQYTFNAHYSLKSFFQYDEQNEVLSTNLRFRYNPSEGTDLYIVYNQNLNTSTTNDSPIRPTVQNQALILKYSYTLIY